MEKWLPGYDDTKIEKKYSFSKNELITRLLQIKKRGWITLERHRKDRDGGLGNTLEDLLGIPENNFPIADYGTFELKTHRSTSNSLISLFRFEPKPGKVIPTLVKNYGWPLEKYGPKERSLRIDIDAAKFSERGFIARESIEVNGTKLTEEQISVLYEMNLSRILELLHSWKLIEKETRDDMFRVYEKRNSYTHPKMKAINPKKDAPDVFKRVKRILINEFVRKRRS
jgi:hypothetical protein